MSAFMWGEVQTVPVNPGGNGREALVIGFLNYVNSSGHLVIGFTVFDGVFEIVLECY